MTMLEDPYYYSDEARLERCYWRRVGLAIVGGILLAVILLPLTAQAEARYSASSQGIVITLYSEECKLKEVANLPYRATWTENGKTFEGCFSVAGELKMVMLYFVDDRSVAVVPVGVFREVKGV